MVGLSHVAIGNFLSGQTPKSDHLYALAKHFGVTMEWLLTGAGGDLRQDNGGEASCARCAALEREVADLRRRLEAIQEALKMGR